MSSVALGLPRHTTSTKTWPCPNLQLTACNDAAKSSCALNVDEVKEKGVVGIVSRNTLGKTCLSDVERPRLAPFYSRCQVTGCDRAGFTFARCAGDRGDQNAVSPDDIIIIL